MTLGWSPGEPEIVPWEQIVAAFRLEDVNHSPAFFDVKKLVAFNKEYIKALPVADLVDAVEPWASRIEGYSHDVMAAIAPYIQERLERLGDVAQWVDFLFLPSPVMDPDAWDSTMSTPTAAPILDGALTAYEGGPWDAETLKSELVRIGESHGLKLGKAQAPVRVAVSGRTVGPPLFEALEVLGRDATLRRLRAARARLETA
jgi:glutamyl-tRNA synthetase